jgi:hypothetical protein
MEQRAPPARARAWSLLCACYVIACERHGSLRQTRQSDGRHSRPTLAQAVGAGACAGPVVGTGTCPGQPYLPSKLLRSHCRAVKNVQSDGRYSCPTHAQAVQPARAWSIYACIAIYPWSIHACIGYSGDLCCTRSLPPLLPLHCYRQCQRTVGGMLCEHTVGMLCERTVGMLCERTVGGMRLV